MQTDLARACVRVCAHVRVRASVVALRVCSLPTQERKDPLAKQFTCRLAIFAKTKRLKDASVSSVGVAASVPGCLRFPCL